MKNEKNFYLTGSQTPTERRRRGARRSQTIRTGGKRRPFCRSQP